MRRSVFACALWLLGCRDGGAANHLFDAGPDGSPADGLSFDAYCPSDAQGGGVCPINFCGYLKSVAALSATEVGQSGADSLCSDGRICVATEVVPTGDAIQLTCVAPLAGAVAYGMPCTTGAGSATRCKDDSLCITTAAAPAAPFCSALCRIDADCPAGSSCLDQQTPALPNGSYGLVGMCVPNAMLAQTTCKAEADCPAGQGCVQYQMGERTSLLVCRTGGASSLGTACTEGSQCRSGECYDRDFRFGSGSNRAFCSGICGKNSDCGPDQICVQEVISNNGTPADPRDDLVAGYCQSLFVPTVAAACKSNQDCVAAALGADTCHPTYGLCYNSTAVIGGGPCASDDACGMGVTCVTGPTFAGGACLSSGCAPAATTGVDSCPTGAVCSQRPPDAPLYLCYEACSTPGGCARISEDYYCAPAQDGQSDTICLSR